MSLPGQVRALLVVIFLALGPSALAHPSFSATALIKVSPGGDLTLTLRHDALAFALDDLPSRIADRPMLEFLQAPEATQQEAFTQGRDRFATLTTLTADGTRVDLILVEAPTVAGLKAWRAGHTDRALPVKLDFVAHATLPPETRALTIEFPAVLGDCLLTIDRPGVEPLGFPLLSGETSPPLVLPSPHPTPNPPPAEGGAAHEAPGSRLSWFDVSKRYITLGFTHIIPGGFDHALFVFGLFLLSPRVNALLWQITAFTIAHSLTLTLTTLHLLTLPSILIEPTIAASIAFIAIENLSTTRAHRLRPLVAFIFGLVHGMGFASALSEVGLPTGQLIAGLVAFNLGVEGGHLTILSAAFLLLGWWREKHWYRPRVAIPLSVLIAAIALVWFVQRVMQ